MGSASRGWTTGHDRVGVDVLAGGGGRGLSSSGNLFLFAIVLPRDPHDLSTESPGRTIARFGKNGGYKTTKFTCVNSSTSNMSRAAKNHKTNVVRDKYSFGQICIAHSSSELFP